MKRLAIVLAMLGAQGCYARAGYYLEPAPVVYVSPRYYADPPGQCAYVDVCPGGRWPRCCYDRYGYALRELP